MAKKGYDAEYMCKQELSNEFGEHNVIKSAIGQAMDFVVLQKGRLIKLIEVKQCHLKKFYPKEREVVQFNRIKDMALEHGCSFELWIRFPKKRKWEKQIYYDGGLRSE
jgi:hypothetical protein